VRDLLERGAPGAIVNVSSKAGSVSLPYLSAYCASKGAVDQLTRSMAYELGPHNVRFPHFN